MSKTAAKFDEWYVRSSYEEFVQQEGVPLYEGSALEDLATLELGDWERRGGKAAYTRMGEQENYSLQIVEIPPKGELKPEHHVYDAVMYVMKGRGATAIWQEGEPRQTVEWEEGSLLAIPLNAWHQEFNSSGDEPCRLLFGTNMAHVINLYHNFDFVFNNPFSFQDRYSSSMKEFYTDGGIQRNLRLFETNFIPDIRRFALDPYPERGIRTSIMRLSMASVSLGIHVMSVSEGTYVTAHRHDPGAHVIAIEGQGYELLFMPGEENRRRKVPADPYAVIAPRRNEYHQHFNTGKGIYRMLAFRGVSLRYGSGRKYDPAYTAQDKDPYAYGFKISYEKEDPAIREEYYRELEKNGITLRMEPVDQGGG
ncbi:MAG: cupin domain-containing protein [Deltaproteobacteria bacterium]|nr:cupin domain-containing protein [Deltaproteobacteria bacterium]